MEKVDGLPEVHPNDALVVRLDNWVNERPAVHYRERRVRRNIANAIATDLLEIEGTPNVSRHVESYRVHVAHGITNAKEKLQKLQVQENGLVKESAVMTDAITGTHFLTRMRREGDAWISEELGDDGAVISRAKIDDAGEVALTLNYPGRRYEEKNANPKLENETRFPTGAKVLFLNHAASLGIISWRGE